MNIRKYDSIPFTDTSTRIRSYISVHSIPTVSSADNECMQTVWTQIRPDKSFKKLKKKSADDKHEKLPSRQRVQTTSSPVRRRPCENINTSTEEPVFVRKPIATNVIFQGRWGGEESGPCLFVYNPVNSYIGTGLPGLNQY